MSIYEEANLVLKLYELRRDPVMRAARDWYAVEFLPESVEEFNKIMYSEHSGHLPHGDVLLGHGSRAREPGRSASTCSRRHKASASEHSANWSRCLPISAKVSAPSFSPIWRN